MFLKEGILYSDLLSDLPVVHGFTTRQKGNLGFGKNAGDPEVITNRRKLFEAVQLTGRIHVQPSQHHTDQIVNAQDYSPGKVADGSFTDSPAYVLSVLTADCVPILIYHPSPQVAAVHCGWRGLQNGILTRALSRFPADSVAVIGPAIGPCCYEVEADLAQRFAESFGKQVVLEQRGRRPHLDLVRCALLQLQESGIRQIDAAHLCTACHGELFFSYRRDGSSGRMLSFITLRN